MQNIFAKLTKIIKMVSQQYIDILTRFWILKIVFWFVKTKFVFFCIQNIQKFQFFFQKNHNWNGKIRHTLDEKKVKNEQFLKIIISSFTLRF